MLAYFTEVNRAYIHPFGNRGTEYLMQKMDLKGNERVLEVGFGTGTTLVGMKARLPGLRLEGVEASEAMLEKARKRLRFCGLEDKVRLHLATREGSWPDLSPDFDLIFSESVFAIQEGEGLKHMAELAGSKLKAGGRLLLNDLVWRRSTPPEVIEKINTQGKAGFGIIQANALYPAAEDWIRLFEKSGFRVLACERPDDMRLPRHRILTFAEFRSRVYSGLGKGISRLNLRLRREWRAYEALMNGAFSGNAKYLEPVIFVLEK